jgi:NTE family protein
LPRPVTQAEAPIPRDDTPQLALALGGGVARGWAHIGVLRTLLQAGIVPDMVAGTSIGAIVGGCYLAGRLAEIEDWARSVNRLRAVGYLDFRVGKASLIGGERLARELDRHLGRRRIEDLPAPFVAVATDLVTGHEVWLRRGRMVDILRASFAVPGVFPPMQMDGRWLVDGALVNPIPVSVCVAAGARMVIGVNVNGEIGRRVRKPGTILQQSATAFDEDAVVEAAISAEREQRGRTGLGGLGGLGLSGLMRQVFRRDPNTPSLLGVMVSSLGIVLDRATRARLAADPPDIQITPRVGHIGLAEFDRAEELIARGQQAAEAAIPDIKDAMTALGLPGSGTG